MADERMKQVGNLSPWATAASGLERLTGAWAERQMERDQVNKYINQARQRKYDLEVQFQNTGDQMAKQQLDLFKTDAQLSRLTGNDPPTTLAELDYLKTMPQLSPQKREYDTKKVKISDNDYLIRTEKNTGEVTIVMSGVSAEGKKFSYEIGRNIFNDFLKETNNQIDDQMKMAFNERYKGKLSIDDMVMLSAFSGKELGDEMKKYAEERDLTQQELNDIYTKANREYQQIWRNAASSAKRIFNEQHGREVIRIDVNKLSPREAIQLLDEVNRTVTEAPIEDRIGDIPSNKPAGTAPQPAVQPTAEPKSKRPDITL